MKTNHYMIEGIKFFKEGKFFHALEKFISALKQDENNPVIRGNLGETYLRLGELNSAIREFEQVVILDRNDFGARYELGRIYFKQKNYYKAYINFTYIYEYNSDMFSDYEIQNYIDHIKIISESMANFEKLGIDSKVHYKIGQLLIDKKLYSLALNELRTAVEIDPDFSEGKIIFVKANYFRIEEIIGKIDLEEMIDCYIENNDLSEERKIKYEKVKDGVKECLQILKKNKDIESDELMKKILVDFLMLDRQFSLAYDHIGSVAEYENLKPRLQKILQKNN
ncbi:hypothetical protein KAJ27_09540 [bacterium]|nr:hypothetical protein [bacterium]